MRVLLLGSTGRIGTLTQRAAVEAGHDVVAIVRTERPIEPSPRVTTIVGALAELATFDAALDGVDAVIAALGARSNAAADAQALVLAMQAVIRAMERSPVRRLVALSGAGVDVPGDRKPLPDRVMSLVVRRAARHIVGAKQAEFARISASQLQWTALRPPLVTDGPARGYRLSSELRPGARVTRADVAQALVDQVGDGEFVREAPFVLPRPRLR